MAVGFVIGGGVRLGARSGVSARCAKPKTRTATPVRMVSVNSEFGHIMDPVSSWSPTVVEFMNKDHKADLLQYFMNFGNSNVECPEEVDDVSLRKIDQSGMRIDVVLCEGQDERCVALQEDIPWVDNMVPTSINDICIALSKMSKYCGLNSEF